MVNVDSCFAFLLLTLPDSSLPEIGGPTPGKDEAANLTMEHNSDIGRQVQVSEQRPKAN